MLLSLLGACKKDYPQCDHFVDLTMQCDSDMKSAPGGEQKTARVMMGGMCEEAFKNNTSNVSGQAKQLVTEMYAELRERADCTSKANTCEQYSRCTDSSTATN
jgi:hypothetical protein